MPASPDLFRTLCGRFATGVVIVTTLDESGPCGMTASSFASVSLQPPLVSVAVDHAATIYPAMRAGSSFVINVLGATQEGLSRRFAAGLPDRFDGVAWHGRDRTLVLLDDALARIHCRTWSQIAAGDHTIFVGEVLDGEVREELEPLLHYHGQYGRFVRDGGAA